MERKRPGKSGEKPFVTRGGRKRGEEEREKGRRGREVLRNKEGSVWLPIDGTGDENGTGPDTRRSSQFQESIHADIAAI